MASFDPVARTFDFNGKGPGDRHEVRAVLATLTSGMIFDLTRFPGEDENGLAAIESLEELDHYIYMVAGCVGPFCSRSPMVA